MAGKSPGLSLEFLLALWVDIGVRWPLGLCEGGTTSPFWVQSCGELHRVLCRNLGSALHPFCNPDYRSWQSKLWGHEQKRQIRCWIFWSPGIMASTPHTPTANHPNPFCSLRVILWGCLQPCLCLFSLPFLQLDLLTVVSKVKSG